MIQNNLIEIPLSKKKLTLTFLGALIFVILGLWFVIKPPQIKNFIFGNPVLIFIIGLVSIIFFGFIAVIIFRKFSDKKPGLTISKEGIIDNSSGVSAGLIPWNDIQEIKISQIVNQKFLMLIVHNPQTYLDRVKNPLKRKTMEINYKNYGSPINISSNSLQTNFNDLNKLLNEKLNEYRM